VGAGDVLSIEERGTWFWEIGRKASTVDKAVRADRIFDERDERQRDNHGEY
jgi:hypothetical protein